jgi:hypothetical protein
MIPMTTRRALAVLIFLLMLWGIIVGLGTWGGQSPPIALTIAAALVGTFTALFLDAIKGWIWRPHLAVSYTHGDDYVARAELRWVGNGQSLEAPCYFFRILIENHGSRPAERVEVMATELRMQQSDGQYSLVQRYSLNLGWTHSAPAFGAISPGMHRFCDVGHIVRPAERVQSPTENLPSVDQTTTIFSIDLEKKPNNLVHLLQPGRYRLTLIVAASNNRPIHRTFEVGFDGNWFDDMNQMLATSVSTRLLSPAEFAHEAKG